MMQKIDQSPALIRLLNRTSTVFARRRGLPVVIGIVLIAVSLILGLLNVGAGSQMLEVLYLITHHIGILMSFIGLLLAQPLGN